MRLSPTLHFTTRKGRRAWQRFTRGRGGSRTPPRPPKPFPTQSEPYVPSGDPRAAGVAHRVGLAQGPSLPILGSTATGRGIMQVAAAYMVSWGALYAVVKQDLQSEKTRFLASALIAVGVTLVNNVLIPHSAAPHDPMQQTP